MKTLQVRYRGWGDDQHIATLADTGSRILCEWTDKAAALGIEFAPLRSSVSLGGTVTGEPFFEGLPGFIADCLPDGWGRLLMDRAFRRRGINPLQVSPLDRLQIVGSSGIGALCFEPIADIFDEQKIPDALLDDWAKWASAELKAESDSGTNALLKLLDNGGSPQGARPKVMLLFNAKTGQVKEDRWNSAAPANTTDSEFAPWLFKFPAQHEHPEVCAVEATYMKVASKAGIAVPESRFFNLSPRASAFGVRRFDRENGFRVPVQSVGALLHIDHRFPSMDYEDLLRLARHLSGDVRVVDDAFRRCVFNVFMHNQDDHAKNFAFMLTREHRWVLSPAFDLTFSNGPRGQHSTSVLGHGVGIGREQLVLLAKKCGLLPRRATEIIESVFEACSDFRSIVADYPVRKATVTEIARRIESIK